LSHFKERPEKICLNCNADLHGRFCHKCGQENIEPRETVWGLVSHFFYDITHFDGKFFSTTRWLIRRPGFLSKEYIRGRRASYLNPIRMYVFASGFFFILFFSFFVDLGDMDVVGKPTDPRADSTVAPQVKKAALAEAETKQDSVDIDKQFRYTGPGAKADTSNYSNTQPLSKPKQTSIAKYGDNADFFFNTPEFRSIEQYDSMQKALPYDQRDGWLKRKMKRKSIQIDLKMEREGPSVVFRQWIDKFLHTFPQILFISLPLVALILQLLYIRRRKQFYYVNHGIFLIHVYIYSFINLLFFFCLTKIKNSLDWNWIDWLLFVLVLHALWYVYKAMRNFYGQGRGKTLLKFIILNLLTFIAINLLFIIFFIFSAWNVQ
jgi:hypothetical protein